MFTRTKGKIPIFILDYGKYSSYKAHIKNNDIYYGNEYLYINLASISCGEYLLFIKSLNNFNIFLNDFFNALLSTYKDLNFYLYTKDGFTYQTLNPIPNQADTRHLISSFGKYIGRGDFIT